MVNHDVLRSSFDSAASDYDAARPGYPEALIEDVIALSQLPADGRILEVGCGTGQATLPFARRGYRMLCLDIGAEMLALAQRNLRDYPGVHFIRTPFERWPTRIGKFDLVISATAFHWIPREIGYPKAALTLRPGGALAVFANWHPRPFDGFFTAVQPIYQRYAPEMADPRPQVSTEQDIQADAEDIRATGLFETVEIRTYAWQATYTTAEYMRLLNTYSNHRTLDPARREPLYRAIAALINEQFAGRVERPYLSVLFLAQKASVGGSI